MLILTDIAFAKKDSSTIRKYKEYVADFQPLKNEPKLYREYMSIYYTDGKDTQTQEQIERGFRIVESVLKKNPKWVDGMWLLGSIAFQWAGTYQEEKDLPLARKILVQGQEATKKCLEIEADNPLCKLFLGSMIGSIGTIDGVFASIRRAKDVERLWLEVVNSEYNYNFYPTISMQGSVRYGLGIFYRLVPDLRILSWFFGVRGSIDKSIVMHRAGISIDGTNVCSDLMLAASIVCKESGEKTSSLGKEGFSLLDKAAASKPKNITFQVCAKDAGKILHDPGLACGYSTAKQQDIDEEKIDI